MKENSDGGQLQANELLGEGKINLRFALNVRNYSSHSSFIRKAIHFKNDLMKRYQERIRDEKKKSRKSMLSAIISLTQNQQKAVAYRQNIIELVRKEIDVVYLKDEPLLKQLVTVIKYLKKHGFISEDKTHTRGDIRYILERSIHIEQLKDLTESHINYEYPSRYDRHENPSIRERRVYKKRNRN